MQKKHTEKPTPIQATAGGDVVDLKAEFKLVEEAGFATFRGVSLQALRNERSRGNGPPFIRIGRKTFYPLEKLRAYLAASSVTPASAPTLVDAKSRHRPRKKAQALAGA